MRRGQRLFWIAVLMSLALPATALAGAASGDPDGSFDGDGFATIGTGDSDEAEAVAIHDGKIISVGYAGSTGLVARFESDGDPDPSFGGGDGFTTLSVPGSLRLDDVAALPNGKIVAAGGFYDGTKYNGVVIRLKANGTPDNTFGGGDGMFTSDFGLSDGVDFYDLARVAGGKIYVTGEAYPDNDSCDMALWRFNANGSPDTSFSGDGMTRVNRGSGNCDGGWRLLPLPNGDVLVGGWSQVEGGDYDVGMARWNYDGSLDRNFGYRGWVTYNPTSGDNEYVAGLVVANNRVYVAVGAAYRNDGEIALLRLKMGGGADVNFGGGDGEVVIDLGGNEALEAMDMDAEGRLVLAGQRDGSGFVARVSQTGTLDSSFNNPDGFTLTSQPTNSTSDVAIAPNGRIVIVGASSGGDLYAARFHP